MMRAAARHFRVSRRLGYLANRSSIARISLQRRAKGPASVRALNCSLVHMVLAPGRGTPARLSQWAFLRGVARHLREGPGRWASLALQNKNARRVTGFEHYIAQQRVALFAQYAQTPRGFAHTGLFCAHCPGGSVGRKGCADRV